MLQSNGLVDSLFFSQKYDYEKVVQMSMYTSRY